MIKTKRTNKNKLNRISTDCFGQVIITVGENVFVGFIVQSTVFRCFNGVNLRQI